MSSFYQHTGNTLLANELLLRLQDTISIKMMSTNQQPPKLPLRDLLDSSEDYNNICIPLYIALIKGNWKSANVILSKQEKLVRCSITENWETALHIAVSVQNISCVEELLKIMKEEDLELQNKDGNTVLSFAASAGNRTLAEMLVNANENLLNIPNGRNMMPLHMATIFRKHDTMEYLYDNSPKMADEDGWTDVTRRWFLTECIDADFCHVALKVLNDHPELGLNEKVLEALARRPKAYDDRDSQFSWRKSFSGEYAKQKKKDSDAMELLRKIWKEITKMPREHILKGKEGKYSPQVLFDAAEMGNTEFLVEIISQCPDLMWTVNANKQTIFHVAVSHRHERIYNLLHEIGSMKDMIAVHVDTEGNNILHLAGMEPKNYNGLHHIRGDVFKMQWELLWFKEVEAMVPFSYRQQMNNDGETPHELFTKNHKKLASTIEIWMKQTATQCIVVAALIATIVFGVAFTIPGGYDQTSGFPTFMGKEIFIAFVISDAISLIFSAVSILVFLSVLTSGYDEQDFLKSLSQKLVLGLATLFLSVLTMLAAFSLSFFVLYHSKLIWVPIVISIVAVVPVVLYTIFYGSLMDVYHLYHSSYGYKYIFESKQQLLYQNPKY
ncbi:putative ankyrin repeat-containing domain, major facilitator superfamily domain, PGG [Helianthus annuus]|nr:putative ankyrin repeat-containing domain, major facilitator superfamily domain, PGG [Helianthus annuus]